MPLSFTNKDIVLTSILVITAILNATSLVIYNNLQISYALSVLLITLSTALLTFMVLRNRMKVK